MGDLSITTIVDNLPFTQSHPPLPIPIPFPFHPIPSHDSIHPNIVSHPHSWWLVRLDQYCCPSSGCLWPIPLASSGSSLPLSGSLTLPSLHHSHSLCRLLAHRDSFLLSTTFRAGVGRMAAIHTVPVPASSRIPGDQRLGRWANTSLPSYGTVRVCA
ncbi:hypothetical protein BU24DRAFT_184187 [Aaosphaeria arxii CBS 175.79]|uniref:Uncharacterized protein n=1 Tax=Aaosphaeria arxii CBS 175.79 TaxID=1450172 RepID=A0A6A5XS50_9PLEO|nr:uncharacterized protein BU24DRAFT_184187 [Aaosphaeria arxii CBS 175.79]KAF2015726.1 hypothetical protein BU24DRAFT_184187 [Aaosphaeria arxii CBS 175.79]